MKYLLIEDNKDKAGFISGFINSNDSHADVLWVDNLSDARIQLLTKFFDLIIFDVFLPVRKGEDACDISSDIISDFSQSQNFQSESIAITRYVDEGLQTTPLFNDNGITVVVYAEDNPQWQESLRQKMNRIGQKSRLDFVVFCALSKERLAYSETNAKIGELKQIGGLDCQEMTIGTHRGVCVKPSRMGLVNMAIVATKAIELFRPKIVAMSGICAGVEGESSLLDIVIGDVCWEYQTGKFKDGKFKQEPYQVPLNRPLKIELEQFSQNAGFLAGLKLGLYETELKDSGVKFGPISSGSAVVADADKMTEIGMQHRKWTALEMEMYAMYEAASHSVISPLFFGAKAVVDMGDATKGDTLHSAACTLSARFVVEFLQSKLPALISA